MATYSNIGIKLITTGDESGTWGTSTNTNFSDVLDEAIAGAVTYNISSDANFTLTVSDGTSSDARHAVIKFTSTTLTATRTCTFAPDDLQKTWVVINATTGGQSLTFKQGSAGATVTVPNGESAIIYSDGAGSTNGAITRVLDSFTNTKITTGTLNATTLDLTNLEVTNIKAKDGTAAASIADSTGVVSFTANPILSGGTANGVLYLNGSKVATSGTALVFDGTNLGVGTSTPAAKLDIGGNTAATVQAILGRGVTDSNFTVRYTNGASGSTAFIGALGLDYANGTWADMAAIKFYRNNTAGELAFFASAAAASGTEGMRLTSTGLGIGTSSPSAKLDIGSGNLTFSSTAQRITGDMTTTTFANRLSFQTNVTNGVTSISALPNGTATGSNANFYNNSDPTNSGLMLVGALSSEAIINSTIRGTGTYLPMTFYTGGSERMRLDTSGNLGLGTASPGSRLVVGNQSAIYGGGTTNENIAIVAGTPPSADTTRGMFGIYDQTSAAAGVGGSITFGGSFSGTTQTFFAGIKGVKANATPADATGDLLLAPRSGNTIFYGAMYSSERMRIDSSGNVGIGTASPSNFGGVNLQVQNSTIGSILWSNGTITGQLLASASAEVTVGSRSNHPLRFGTNDTERMRIDTSGNVGIGGTASAFDRVTVTGTLPSSSAFSIGFGSRGTIPSTSTSLGIGFSSVPNTQAASFTLSGLTGFYAGQGTFGAGSTVTNQYGYYAENNLTGATNNFGFYSNIASGTNRWNFYAAGTADNYFAGNVQIGTTTAAAGGLLTLNKAPAAAFGSPLLQVGGASFTSGGYYSIGLGFTDATYTEPPGEIAFITTSDSGGTLGAIAFGTRSVTTNTAVTERARITSGGDVGIGTTSPTTLSNYKFITTADVNGGGLVCRSGSTDRLAVYSAGSDAYYDASVQHIFRTGGVLGGTERARITSGGYFKASNDGTYVNSTASYHEFRNTGLSPALWLSATNASYNSAVLQVRASRNTTNATFYAIEYYNDGAAASKFIVADSGNVTNTNGSYGTISDAKMKTDIVDANSQWADIKGLRFRKFKMKDDPVGLTQLGVVAQEVEQVSPGLVEEHADFEEVEVTDDEGNVKKERQPTGTTTKSVKTSVLLMKAAVALQEAMARIEKLEAEVAALKGV